MASVLLNPKKNYVYYTLIGVVKPTIELNFYFFSCNENYLSLKLYSFKTYNLCEFVIHFII